jgi:hypothetical protein
MNGIPTLFVLGGLIQASDSEIVVQGKHKKLMEILSDGSQKVDGLVLTLEHCLSKNMGQVLTIYSVL